MLEGDSQVAESNKLLATLDLKGLPPTPMLDPETGERAGASIEVAFWLDEDGLLTVGVRDLRTGRQQRWAEGAAA